jgi:hypothetical protein
MKNLNEIFNEYGGDKGTYFVHEGTTENIAHGYTEVYEKFMEKYRNKEINMLEIGLWCPYFPGSSVKAWDKYFSKFNYYGIDIVDCKQLSSDRINIDIVDQKNEKQLENYLKDKPDFKFIIDDGCHEEDAITISLGTLFDKLESGGIYFIEDLHVVDKTRLYKLKDKKFDSKFISKEKIKYINENIKECYFDCNDKLCIIIKK